LKLETVFTFCFWQNVFCIWAQMTNHEFAIPEAVTDCFFRTFSSLNQLIKIIMTFINFVFCWDVDETKSATCWTDALIGFKIIHINAFQHGPSGSNSRFPRLWLTVFSERSFIIQLLCCWILNFLLMFRMQSLYMYRYR